MKDEQDRLVHPSSFILYPFLREARIAMNEMTWLALLFLAVALLTFAALRRLARARQQQAERWKEVEDALEPTPAPKLPGPMADAPAAQVPLTRPGVGGLP